MRMDDERESRNVDDRRASTGRSGGGMPSMQTMMILWPIVKPLFKSKFGMLIIGAGVAAYFMGYNPLALIGMGGASSQAVDKMKNRLCSLKKYWQVRKMYGKKSYVDTKNRSWYSIVGLQEVDVVMPLHRWDLFIVLQIKKSILI